MSNHRGPGQSAWRLGFYVVGDRSHRCSHRDDGRLTALNWRAGLSGTHSGGAFDPSLPNTMYATSPSFNGVFQAAIERPAGLTLGQGFTRRAVPTDFALAP